jgi:hypothetical protein
MPFASRGASASRMRRKSATICGTAEFRRDLVERASEMPIHYSLDLRWRIVWSFICHRRSFADIAASFSVCERTVRRYVDLFQRTGDVRPYQRRHGCAFSPHA